MKSKFKFELVIFLILLFCIPLVSGKQPTPQEGGPDSQLSIAVPQIEFYPIGKNFTLNFHVYNQTGFLQDNSSLICSFHLYNNRGVHLIETDLLFESDDMEFYIDLNSSVMTSVGLYSYIVSCNDSVNAGFYTDSIEMNDRTSVNGYWSGNMIAITIALIAMIAFFLIIGFIAYSWSSLIMSRSLFWLAFTCFSLALTELILLIGLIYVNEAGGSAAFVGLLRINFYAMAILGFGVGMITLFIIMMNIFRADDTMKERWKGKW